MGYLNDPRVHFAFRVNMMINELVSVIREQLSPSQVNWASADKELLIHLSTLDTTIGRLNTVSEGILRNEETKK